MCKHQQHCTNDRLDNVSELSLVPRPKVEQGQTTPYMLAILHNTIQHSYLTYYTKQMETYHKVNNKYTFFT